MFTEHQISFHAVREQVAALLAGKSSSVQTKKPPATPPAPPGPPGPPTGPPRAAGPPEAAGPPGAPGAPVLSDAGHLRQDLRPTLATESEAHVVPTPAPSPIPSPLNAASSLLSAPAHETTAVVAVTQETETNANIIPGGECWDNLLQWKGLRELTSEFDVTWDLQLENLLDDLIDENKRQED